MGTQKRKELLEMAAKAAGIELACWDEERAIWIRVKDDPEKVRQSGRWASAIFDPLDDDGDALRLAAKLRLDVEFHKDRMGEAVTAINYDLASQKALCGAEARIGDDVLEAMRRAIVRAAAQIGKAMP